MKPVSSFVGGSGTGSTGLGSQSGTKKKVWVESIYTWNSFYKKKSKKPDVTGVVVNSSAGPLPRHVLQTDCGKCKVFWSSKIESKDVSISGMSNVENMDNIMAKKTSYVDANTSETNDMVDNATSRKMQTRTYVLEPLPKTPSFKNLSDNNAELVLPESKFAGSNQLPSAKSHVLERHSFEPVRSFALDMELAAVPGKTNGNKIDGFGEASILSKFPEIIRFLFTSESSMNKAKELAIYEKIVVNNDLKRVSNCSDKKIVVKKILVNFPKLAVESVFSKFGKIVSIKMQLIGLWQKALVEFESSEIADLVAARWSVFMKKDSVHVVKAMCFVNKTSKLAAIGSTPVFKSMNLCWASLSLACCAYCKQFGHISTGCLLNGNFGVYGKQVVTPQNQICLANIYKRKQTSIVYPVFFSEKTWAQVADGFFSHVGLSDFFGTDSSSDAKPVLLVSNSLSDSCLIDQLASLEHSLGLLMDQVSIIMKKLSFVELVPLVSKPHVSPSVVLVPVMSNLNLKMALNNTLPSSPPSLLVVVVDSVVNLSSSSSKVLTTKVGGLESKMVALEVSVEFVLERLNCLCSGLSINVPTKQKDIIHWHRDSENLVSIITETKLKFNNKSWIRNKFNEIRIFSSGLNKNFLGAGITIIMNTSLAHHVCKIFKVPGWLFLVKLLFKNKFSVSILGLYVKTSLAVCFFQANDINSVIARAVNESLFVVLGSNFNENGFQRCASFKRCLDLGLVNFLDGSFFVKMFTWTNFQGMAKTINFLFVSLNLVNAIVDCKVSDVGEFFDTDHHAVFASVSLGGLLNVQYYK
ncbi:hypothetical protein G9A89_015973 [Geosiphon pyriformis]|nr:hypothetical protein G9A89_015973 [Geosiphon pyriformis]